MAEIVTILFRYKYIILFYLLLAIFLLLNRKKLTVYAKFIILYRMKWGLTWMDKYASRFREWIILLGYVGVGAGFLGLVLISYVLIKNLIDLATQPEAVSGVSLVLPGINVPGLGVLPFWYWIIAIFIIAVVHEFSHGIVARAHNIKVQHTGLVFFGPILGAFVEPDEKKLRKENDFKQYSVLAAGSFSNVILAVFALVLFMFVFTPIQTAMVEPTGFTFSGYSGESNPFETAGIVPGTLITGLDDLTTEKFQEFSDELAFKKPGDRITVHLQDTTREITLAANPDNEKKAFMGIMGITNEFEIKEQYSLGIWNGIYYIINWLAGFFSWLFVLSLGIGLFNLLPLPIVDGGRMAQVFLHKLKGAEVGERRYRQIGMLFLVILLLNLFFPLLVKLF